MNENISNTIANEVKKGNQDIIEVKELTQDLVNKSSAWNQSKTVCILVKAKT